MPNFDINQVSMNYFLYGGAAAPSEEQPKNAEVPAEQKNLVESHRPQGVVVVPVSQHHTGLQRCNLPYKAPQIAQAVGRIDEERPVSAREQRHAHAHGVPDVPHTLRRLHGGKTSVHISSTRNA